jgi:hypothetical protein
MDCKYAVVQSSGAHNFYWVSIAHTILPSFTLPQTAPGHKKQKQKQTVSRADKKSRWVVELWSVTEVSEETGRGLNAGSILKSAAGRRNR